MVPDASAEAEVEGGHGAARERAERVIHRVPAGCAMGGDCKAFPFVEETGGGDGGERAAAGGLLPDSAAAPASALPTLLIE